MIRILQVGASRNLGGVENCLLRYFRHIDKNNFVFDFADIYGDGLAGADEIRALGGNIYTFHNYKKHPLKMMRDMSELLKTQPYDIIHIHMLSAANLLPALVACQCGTAKVIAHSHSASVPSELIRKTLNWTNRIFLRRMPLEKWACSKVAGVWMWGNRFNEANVLPNAIESEMFQYDENVRRQVRNLCGYADEHIVVGFVGRLCEAKNILFLPEIIAKLIKKSPNYRMLIIGDSNIGDDSLKQQLSQKIQRMGLLDYVFMAGRRDDVSRWYQAMDAFVLPSCYEGLGIVGIEAQAAGLPCFFSENVPKECALTENCHFLPLNLGASEWAEAIQYNVEKERKPCDGFSQSYQIDYAAKILEERYRHLSANEK